MVVNELRIHTRRAPSVKDLFPISVPLSALARIREGKLKELQARWHTTPLERLYEDLLAHFSGIEDIELDPQRIRSEMVSPGSSQEHTVHQILDYGYSSRYQVQGTVVDRDVIDSVQRSTQCEATFAAVQDFNGRCIILSTVRIVWANPEIFEYFEMCEHGRWPHQETTQGTGEMGKFSEHPILDLLSNSCSPGLSRRGNIYKELVFRKAMEPAMALLKEKKIDFFYYIAPPRVQRFFERAGLRSSRIERAALRKSPAVQILRELYPLYLAPSELPENQPGAYYCPVLPVSSW